MASMTMGQGHARGALLPVQSGQCSDVCEGLRMASLKPYDALRLRLRGYGRTASAASISN